MVWQRRPSIAGLCVLLILVTFWLGFLVAGCKPTPTPVNVFEAAVQAEIEKRITEFSGAGLRHYRVLHSRLTEDGRYGRLEARIVLEACPHFYYDLYYNGELKDGRWVLYNDEETLSNLFKRWATAHSAALGGETVDVPGSEGRRHVRLIPEAMVDLLKERLKGFSSSTVDPLVGFFLCEKENIAWDKLDPQVQDELRELMPQVEKLMDEELSTEVE